MPTLQWLGRDEDIKAAYKTPYKLLKEIPENGYGDKDTGNMLIHGDNLEALKALLPFYAGQVKCIFIDPPYNTGSRIEANGSAVGYDDNLEHSIWCQMMYPRLLLLQQFLSKKGTIFITLDDNEAHYGKIICDEIFGRNNFISNIIWNSRKSVSSDTIISGNHNHILSYAKDIDLITNLAKKKKLFRLPLNPSDFSNPDNDPRGPWAPSPFDAPEIRTNLSYGIENPNTHKIYYPANGRHWSTTKDEFERLLKDNRIIFGLKGRTKPQLKRFLCEAEENDRTPKSIWTELDTTTEATRHSQELFGKENTFPNPKPEDLIERILYLSTEKNDLVFDSFLGSGTTAAVAQKMGRRFIGIEIGKHAYTHCIPRLKKVIDGSDAGGITESVNWQGGGGFRFYELGDEVFDGDGKINPNITFEQLAAHIWFAETKTPYNAPNEKTTFLGVHKGTAYALLYNGILHDKSVSGGNVLTNKTLKVVTDDIAKTDFDKLVIYGEACRLGEETLNARNIEFRQTPYDVKAR